jgi:hypothetical protein
LPSTRICGEDSDVKAIFDNTWARLLLCWLLAIVLARITRSHGYLDRLSSGWQLAIMSLVMLVLTVVVVAGVIRSEKRREER